MQRSSTVLLRLVFLHGRYEDSTSWEPLSERLSRGLERTEGDLEFLAVDVGGADATTLTRQAQALIDLLEGVIPEGSRIVLVGHDTGGALAQVVVALAPSRVSGLVLMNTASPFLPCDPIPFERMLLSGLHSSHPGYVERLLRQGAGWGSHGRWPSPEEREPWKRAIASQHVPSLLLWGSRDREQSLECTREAFNLFREARLASCECGHWPHLEAVDWTADRMQEFIFQLRYGTYRVNDKRRA